MFALSKSILVSPPASGILALAMAALLMGCGQKGPLVLPTGEAAVGRATLPETLLPTRQPGTTPSAPAAKPTPQPVLR
nr:lipoprotein [Ramlibacter aurantiacus]